MAPSSAGYKRIPAASRPAFAAWLREVLAARGMTQADLADEVGVTPAAVSQWASGRAAPDPMHLAPLARALGVTTATMLQAIGLA